MRPSPSRRRFLTITAAAAGLGLGFPPGKPLRAEDVPVVWRGHAMGAQATLQIHHHDVVLARRLVDRCVDEVRRLERIFSLYQSESAVSRLNRQGFLLAPPSELVALLEAARECHDLTDGAFDVTVQPLWTLYHEHFTQARGVGDGPAAAAREAVLDRIGFRHVRFDRNRVALGRPGMGVTLNGIAQGFATDRVVELLRSEGIGASLVDMGEPRGLGSTPDGTPWRVGIADPDDPTRLGDFVGIVDKAVATSGGYGFTFDLAGRFHHLLDPSTGLPAQNYRSVTVILPEATQADALSTAFSAMPLPRIEAVLRKLGAGEARLVTTAGEPIRVAA